MNSIAEIAREFGRRVRELAGARLLEVRVFGSRARGDARPGSDLDLWVLTDREDRELARFSTLPMT